MNTRTRIDFDELMRILMIVGFGALATWAMTAAVGVMSGFTYISAIGHAPVPAGGADPGVLAPHVLGDPRVALEEAQP